MSNQATGIFGDVKKQFSFANDVQTLQYCLGILELKVPESLGQDVQKLARLLEQQTILVTIDCEHYTLNSSEMTEIGIAVLKRTDVADTVQQKNFGDHAENLMHQVRYHFLRLREKSHLLTSNPRSNGPDGNRFGESRFVSFAKARQCLNKIMVQPIEGIPALKGLNHPVIVMGHAIGHDREHLGGKDLDFNMVSLGTVIKFIDTQKITTEMGYWLDPLEDIGLDRLVAKLEFEHTDSHTAANDAARTLMCGILMVVPKSVRMGCQRSIEQVASDAEHYSRNTFVGLGGTREYCCKCGSTDHMHVACTVPKSKLYCDECFSRGLANDKTIPGHITLHCPIKRDEVAAVRLQWYADQDRNWKPKWAFDSTYFHQTWSHDAPPLFPTTKAEVDARSAHYRRRQGQWTPQNVFKSPSFAFRNSPLRFKIPTRKTHALRRDAQGNYIDPAPAQRQIAAQPFQPVLAPGNFPPLGPANQPRGGGNLANQRRGQGEPVYRTGRGRGNNVSFGDRGGRGDRRFGGGP